MFLVNYFCKFYILRKFMYLLDIFMYHVLNRYRVWIEIIDFIIYKIRSTIAKKLQNHGHWIHTGEHSHVHYLFRLVSEVER